MKKFSIIVILLFMVVLAIDSINYLNNYNKQVELVEQLKMEGYTGEGPRHLNVFDKMKDYYNNGALISIQFIYPLLIIIFGCVSFHKKIHNGFFKNITKNKEYKKYINKEIFNSWKSILIIPLFFIIIFLASCIVTNFNFDLQTNSMFQSEFITNGSLFSNFIDILLICINLMLVSIFIVNIGILFVKFNNNFIISCVISYLFLIIYQIVCEIIIVPFLTNITGSYFFANGLTLFNFWHYDTGVTALSMTIYSLLLIAVSLIILKINYHNKNFNNIKMIKE